MWAAGSIGFIFVYFVFHLKSIILAGYSIVLIVLSFGVTQAIYVGALKINFFITLHNMVIFIVLGITADNIFVFNDFWNQSAIITEFEGSLRKRMAFTFKKSS